MYFSRLLVLCSICTFILSTIIPQELAIRPMNIDSDEAHQFEKEKKGIHGLMKRRGFGGGSRGGFSSGSSSGSRGGSSSGSSSGHRGRGGRTGAGIGAGLGIGAATHHRHGNSSNSQSSESSSDSLKYDLSGSFVKIGIALLLTLA